MWQYLLMLVVVVAVVYYMYPRFTPKPPACSSCPGKSKQ
jgi:hypothetical protein